MKKSLTTLFLSLISLCVFAQFSQPISWIIESKPLGDNKFEITATGTFSEEGWHIYDIEEYQGGPNSTVFTVEGDGVTPLGKPVIKSEVKKYFDEAFGMEIGICENTVVISQEAEITSAQAVARVEWQACNEGNCLPPDEFEKTLQFEQAGSTEVSAEAQAGDSEGGKSIWGLILAAIAWGFVALLTPCVFPMVPMTVSFFMKQEGSKGRGKWLATVFGLSIVALYTLPIAIIILITYFTGGAAVTADIFNWLATHWLPNLLFFTIFMIFAASFFGAFEIRMPNELINKSDAKSYKGGLGGVFFVALTLVLVSFSCTGPIVGSVLIKSTQGEFWEPIVTMLAFSLAFALPFTILAFVPSLLKKLPKSGGWLNSVKVVLGFIEIALGLKFLSVADQTYHWGLLDRETYLAIWITVFTLLGLYLMGKIKFAADSEVKHLSVFRLLLIIIDFSFVVYMLPGMWGAPLKALSGYLPPITTQDFVLGSQQNAGIPLAEALKTSDQSGHKYSDFLKLPYGIPAYYDYEEARAAAVESGKPMLIDFTGHGCVNCREMESRVWSDPRVLKMMSEDFVVCALYADDKKVVDEKDWVTTADGKVLKTLGKINSHFALERFNVNAQPYYAILDPATEAHKAPSRGYNLDVEAFVAFLQQGLE